MNTPPPEITRDDFLRWRSPLAGTANPETMTNPVWTWIVEQRLLLESDEETFGISASEINAAFRGPSSFNAGPCWCFSRFGQSRTELSDGRVVFVAGEHEDFYDPDFHIYNDVVVVEASGAVSIFGYPDDDFPPTDFHTATPVGDSLILIGNLGYPDDRRPGETQVLRLEWDSWRISPVETSGTPPGWIHGHRAELSEDGKAIRITGGKIDWDDSGSLPENIHDWSLELETGLWSCTNRRNWRRFEFRRKDEKWLRLWDLRNRLMMRKLGMEEKPGFLTLLIELLLPGLVPDPALLETLYAPSVATEIVPQKSLLETADDEEDEYGVYRIRVGEVIVRYVEDSASVFMTIEGELPAEIVEELKKDLTAKLTRLERVRIVCREFE